MRRLIPLALIVVGLALATRSLLQGPAADACMRHAVREQSAPFARIASRSELRATLAYDDGRELDVPLGAQRIVSTVPGITEMIAHLGAIGRLVAVSAHCDTPPVVRQLPSISVLPLSVERLLERRPELVIMDRRLHRNVVEDVLAQDVAVLLLDTSRSLSALAHSFELLAEVIDNDRARDAAQIWREDLTVLLAGFAPLRATQAVRAIAVAQWEPLYVMGPGSLLHDMMAALGLANVACDLPQNASGPFSGELAISRQPAWVLAPSTRPAVAVHRAWSATPAFQARQVLPADGDVISRGGPRTLLALERLAEQILGYEVPEDADVDASTSRDRAPGR